MQSTLSGDKRDVTTPDKNEDLMENSAPNSQDESKDPEKNKSE
jgi:hypothetical protein